MLVLFACWFLFALPAFLWLSLLLGAKIYHAGQRGETPRLSFPSFTFRRGGNGKVVPVPERERFPDV
jgi:hypothetical protein